MTLSKYNLRALKIIPPSALTTPTLVFLEFMKYETDDLRNEKFLDKEVIVERFQEIAKIKTGSTTLKRTIVRKDFEEFAKQIDQILVIKNEKEAISEIKWDKLTEICDLFRRIEKSDERKVRWALYHIFSKGKQSITLEEIKSLLKPFKISNIEKNIKKILKEEYLSGFNASFDGSKFTINHEKSDKLVDHYLADSLEEESRRHPGELEDEILQLIDEGSYSNQEISKILSVDESMVSRTISKLRNKNKIMLSSFGTKGTRFYTTNCENCPFGKTIASCRKDALSYIITSFKQDFNIDLSSNDFDSIETNQALLQIKRTIMMAHKDSNTRLERNLNENLAKLLSTVVTKNLEVKTPNKTRQIPQVKVELSSTISKLPFLYLMGLHKGAESGLKLVDEILKTAMMQVKKEDRLKIKMHSMEQINKFMKSLDLD